LIAFSIGAATVALITSADAPADPLPVTTGGAISGYCAIGSMHRGQSCQHEE
jgi:hypothetical protein